MIYRTVVHEIISLKLEVKGVVSRYLHFFKKLKRFSHRLNLKNNGSVLLFKTIFRH